MKHNDANGSPDNINFALNVNIYKRETTLRLNGRHKERFLFNWRVDRCLDWIRFNREFLKAKNVGWQLLNYVMKM